MMGMLSLSLWVWSCFHWVGSHFLLVDLRTFLPDALVPVRGVIVAYCLDCVLAFVISGVVKLLSLSPSFLLKKKNFFLP
jgi:hypothetical protein